MALPSNLRLHPPKHLGHLPVIYDTLRSTGILSTIDAACGTDPRMNVSHGDCVAFILLGVFAGEHGLWRLAQRLDPYDLATVMDDDGIDVSEYHDVRLGRTLDAIYDAGPDRLYSAIALPMIASQSLSLDTLHIDSTSLSFFGAYEEELDEDWAPELSESVDIASIPERQPLTEEHPNGDGREAPLVVHGYAKNRRFDLKQILFGMAVTSDGGIPLYGRAMNGNTADVTMVCEFLDVLRKELPHPTAHCFVADCKAWSPGSLEVVRKHRLRLLSRLPRSTGLAQELIYGFTADNAPCLLRRYHPSRKRWGWIAYQGADREYAYEVEEAVVDAAGKPEHDESGQPRTRTVKLTMPVRVVTCFSSEMYRQKVETMSAVAKREATRSAIWIAKRQRRTFACRADAEAALLEISRKQPFVSMTIGGSVVERTQEVRRTVRGRPKKSETKPKAKLVYALVLQTATASPKDTAIRLRRAATSVLIRSRSADWIITDEQMVANYDRQWRCESGFSWLKSGAAINPMFVHTPRRIEALCFLYTIALMVHTLIQRNVRRYLEQHRLGLPYHRDKPSAKITARFFYELYRGVTSQFVEHGAHREKSIYGMDTWTTLGLKAMGASPRAYRAVVERSRK